MSSKSFVKIIASRMKEKNIGVRQLARECGIDASFISKVIQGKRNPPSDEKTIKKIASFLSVDPVMLTIYTGRIPFLLQPVLENQSFVDGLLHRKPAVFEEIASEKNIPASNPERSSSAGPSFSGKKVYQKSDLSEELL